MRVVPTTIGGGFGGKIVLIQPLAAALAVRLKRPVSLVLTRMDEFFAWALSFFVFALILEKLVLQRYERKFFRWREEVAL